MTCGFNNHVAFRDIPGIGVEFCYSRSFAFSSCYEHNIAIQLLSFSYRFSAKY